MKSKILLLLSVLTLASCGGNNPTTITSEEEKNTTTTSDTTNDTSSTTSDATTSIDTTTSPTTTEEPTITTEEKVVVNPEYIAAHYPDSSAQSLTLAEAISTCKTLTTNDKGKSYSSTNSESKRIYTFKELSEVKKIKFKATFIKKLDNKVLLFSDGTNVIKTYNIDNDKVGNGKEEGKKYEIIGIPTLYNYQPSILCTQVYYVNGTTPTDITYVGDGITPSYVTKDTNVDSFIKNKNTAVSDINDFVYSFTGYIGLDTKDSSKNQFVLVDNIDDNPDPFKANFKAIRVSNYQDGDIEKSLAPIFESSTKCTLTFAIKDVIKVNGQTVWTAFIFPGSIK